MNWDKINWVRERVNGEHHQALMKYLLGRTEAQAKAADEEGLTVLEIMRQAFLVKNGHTTVPQCAIKMVRRDVPGVDLSFVITLCRESRDADAHIRELAKALRKKSGLSPEAQAVVDEATVREVMGS